MLYTLTIGQPCNLTLVAPINGTISCNGGQITNETCTFQCDPGFDIHESLNRVCQPDHTWTGVQPYCTKRHCHTLTRPWNGYIVTDEPCMTEYRSQCMVACVEGYHVQDTTPVMYQECRVDEDSNEMYWSDPPQCVCKLPIHCV